MCICVYSICIGMYRGRVSPTAVTDDLNRLYATRSDANGPRGERACVRQRLAWRGKRVIDR